MNVILLLGGLLGLSSVMMAAFVDHSLGLYLSGKALNGLLTAVRYHQLYALVISMIGLNLTKDVPVLTKIWLTRSASLFIIGVTFFSFSIYFSVIVNMPRITYLTPFGGILLMVGWLSLIRAAFLRMEQ